MTVAYKTLTLGRVMSLNGDKFARGARVLRLREARDLTVLDFAAELNAVAKLYGLPQVWTGPRVTKIEKGGQNLAIEDVAVLEVYDRARSWFWWAFGVEKPHIALPGERPDDIEEPLAADSLPLRAVAGEGRRPPQGSGPRRGSASPARKPPRRGGRT